MGLGASPLPVRALSKKNSIARYRRLAGPEAEALRHRSSLTAAKGRGVAAPLRAPQVGTPRPFGRARLRPAHPGSARLLPARPGLSAAPTPRSSGGAAPPTPAPPARRASGGAAPPAALAQPRQAASPQFLTGGGGGGGAATSFDILAAEERGGTSAPTAVAVADPRGPFSRAPALPPPRLRAATRPGRVLPRWLAGRLQPCRGGLRR